jgi:hypothetical protein
MRHSIDQNSIKLEEIILDPNNNKHRITITPQEQTFEDVNIICSNALDILAIYLKGQKIIYMEAKTYCQQILNCLMLPAIFISVLIIIFSIVFNNYIYGNIILASLSGLNSFILSIISYLKLDAKSESHRISSYKFEKLQTLCEFNSGKILFFGYKLDKTNEIVEHIEKEVMDIKDTNKFIVPENIRYNFRNIYSTNIFSIVKMLKNEEINLFNRLIIINNNLLKYHDENVVIEKEKIVKEINLFRNKYLDIDKQFNLEIEKNIEKINCFSWLKT